MKTLNTTTLENRLNFLESYIPHFESINLKVSKVNVAWQLDHSLKVLNTVAISMEKSDPTKYINNFSFLGKVFLKLGYFPRGKARAPKYVTPPEIILKEDLIKQLAEAREHIKNVLTLDENAYFKHPLFGHINKKRVFRFMDTHTNHHLKIVQRILK
ncbi:MAG: DUF1569 domain-containing protein [Polaribacter sp.]